MLKVKKVNVKNFKQAPSMEELKLEKPTMTDASAARYRAQLIASGQLKAGSSQENKDREGFMSTEAIKTLRDSLVAKGMLKPGAGMERLKAAQERKAKMNSLRDEKQ